ncbi:hypothetical protein GCM10010365_17810 [Streptomyces poonensis]|uniref:Methyltransferase domain-containing protein n=1 Tax=Streptomyces poonensis TaxID=68255 RepID=A0A918UEZ6_9ACTN|nr:hypothetical protein GCM10010365_17810 [Streptomyces poonensis]
MTVLRDAELAAAFDHAARGYDLLVAANPGYHAHLRRSVRRLGLPHGGDGLRVLDLGCGTGASTAALAGVLPGAAITAVDASVGILDRAAGKPWPRRVTFVHAPAEGLADAGVRGPFDAVFAGYLFRNTADPDAVLRAVREVLAPRGRLAAHEYTLSGRARHRATWTAVCRGLVLPVASALGDGRLYRHLWRSVVDFDTADRFADRVRAAGFDRVRVLPLPGWQTGITHTVVARRGHAGPADVRPVSPAGRAGSSRAVVAGDEPPPVGGPSASAGGRTGPAGHGAGPAGAVGGTASENDRTDPAGWRTASADALHRPAGVRSGPAGGRSDLVGSGTDMAGGGTGPAGSGTGPASDRAASGGHRVAPEGHRVAPASDRAAPGSHRATLRSSHGAREVNHGAPRADPAVAGGVWLAPADKGFARVGDRLSPGNGRGAGTRNRTTSERTVPPAPAGSDHTAPADGRAAPTDGRAASAGSDHTTPADGRAAPAGDR